MGGEHAYFKGRKSRAQNLSLRKSSRLFLVFRDEKAVTEGMVRQKGRSDRSLSTRSYLETEILKSFGGCLGSLRKGWEGV